MSIYDLAVLRRAGSLREIRDEHTQILHEEKSPRVKYIERIYLEKMRSGERSWAQVVNRIKKIRRASLDHDEKVHILKHLRIQYDIEHLDEVKPAIRSYTIKRRGKDHTVLRDIHGRFMKRT